MRDRDAIDTELRIVAAVRRAVRECGGGPASAAAADRLLDERFATESSAEPEA